MQCEMTFKIIPCPPEQERLYWQALEIVLKLVYQTPSETCAGGALNPGKENS
jgi:hypothetical protein